LSDTNSSMNEEQKTEYTCKACGRPLAQEDVRRCSVCLKKRCPDCVVRIAGRLICIECKNWALGKMEEGLPLKPDGELFLSADVFREKRRKAAARRMKEAAGKLSVEKSLRGRASPRTRIGLFFALGFIVIGGIGLPVTARVITEWYRWGRIVSTEGGPGLVIGAIFLIGIAAFIWQLLESRFFLASIEVSESGIVATTRRGRRTAYSWDALHYVTIAPRKITMRFNLKRKLKIHQDRFPSYWAIAERIRRGCEEHGIRHRKIKPGQAFK